MINKERDNFKFGVNRKKKENPNNRVPFVLTPSDLVIMKNKLYPEDRIVDSDKCGKQRCEVCNNFVSSHIFLSVTKGAYKTNQFNS